MKIGCVVMAAGSSVRFGENKLAQLVDGKPIILRVLEAIPRECTKWSSWFVAMLEFYL